MIHPYPVCLFVGSVAGMVAYLIRSRRLGLGYAFPVVHTIALVSGILIGGRFFFHVQFPDSPTSGYVLYGAVIGATLLHLLSCRVARLRATAIADLVAPSALLAIAGGRIGCHYNGCCYGRPTESILALTYHDGSRQFARLVADGIVDPTLQDSVSVYPTQIIYSATALTIAVIGIACFRSRPRNASVLSLTVCTTAVVNIAIEQLRVPAADVGAITVATIFYGLFATCSAPFLVFSYLYPATSAPELRIERSQESTEST